MKRKLVKIWPLVALAFFAIVIAEFTHEFWPDNFFAGVLIKLLYMSVGVFLWHVRGIIFQKRRSRPTTKKQQQTTTRQAE